MQTNGQIERKSQELAFALIRVAAYIRKTELRNRIDSLSFKFIQSVGLESFELALQELNALKNLVELGKHLLQIEPINAKVVIKEIEALNAEIRQIAGILDLPELSEATTAQPKAHVEIENLKIDSEVAKIRQTRIIEKIRQSVNGKVQLRDLIAEFPGISERTLRYDLKKLFDDGKVTRQGTGGPSNFYTLNTGLSTGVMNR